MVYNRGYADSRMQRLWSDTVRKKSDTTERELKHHKDGVGKMEMFPSNHECHMFDVNDDSNKQIGIAEYAHGVMRQVNVVGYGYSLPGDTTLKSGD